MEQLSAFTGKFHPLLVHLPIGFLLIAVVFIWIKESAKVIKISIGLGALASVASVITGLLLADAGGYSNEVQSHKISGITLAIVSIVMFFIPERFWKTGSVAMTVLILLTGHFGGTLTHGSLIIEKEADNLDLATIDFDNAVFYDDAVKLIFEARCVSCHGDDKQKGGLRLDNPDAISRGGKNGKIIVSGNPEESELVKRIDLPVEDEDHMPPKEKKQLTDEEKKLISMWVASGGDFKSKISKEQVAELRVSRKQSITLPNVDVPSPDEKLIMKLTEAGVAITPVARDSKFLQVNFITVPHEAPSLLLELRPIARNVVVLKLNRTDVEMIGEFENVVELNLANTKVTDAVLDEIAKMKFLERLNLSGTKVTTIKKLQSLTKLRFLNLYNTSVTEELPGVAIERGNYNVPTLQSDTTLLKTPED